MLASRGHEPITYSSEPFEGTGEHVTIVTEADQERWFGPGGWNRQRVFDRWNPDDPCWVDMNNAAIDAIKDRWEPGDMVGLIAGRCQEAIAQAFAGTLVTEWGVGYEGVLPDTVHAYESTYWRAYVSGFYRWGDGRNFDTCVPNAFDPDEYRVGEDHGYLLFVGRHTERKGLEVVRELAKTHEVITAGQDGPLNASTEYRGVVLGDEKAELFAHATAVLVPTTYVEPYGGVACEAMMSGVPAITTDYGAFTETVRPWVTGFRCSTLSEFEQAVEWAPSVRGPDVRDAAVSRYSTDVVADLYDKWLRRCDLLHADGWYTR